MAETKTILTDETGVDIKDAITEGFKSVVNAVGKAALDDISWSEIKADCWAGKHRGKYAIGQCKHIVVNGEICTAQIIGFDHDDLTDAFKEANPDYNNGLGKAAITWFLKNCLGVSYAMHSSSSDPVGWADCTMRTETLADIYENGLDENDGLKEVITPVAKQTATNNDTSTIVTTGDTLFILSHREVFGTCYYDGEHESQYSYANEGWQYEFFEGKTWLSTYATDARRPGYGSYTMSANVYYQLNSEKFYGDTGSNTAWWLRSPYAGATGYFCFVSYGGYVNANTATDTRTRAAFGFCL